ncbi:dihydroorotase [Clostridium sp. CAG:571]|nr:dihydroorotase [Clostridium sp. CAG:571]HJJ06587.1 dihydroorotase [Clostridiaceae bacterium]
MKILLKNGRVVDYASKTNEKIDILIEDGVIIKLQKEILAKADNVIDCTGLVIIPGMIDMHCHLREPGFEYKETIETGSKSAVKGGFTTICPMPNTNPTPDSAFILEKILAEAKRVNLCNILPYGSVSKGEKGEELTDFEELKKAGAVAFSDDGMPVINSRMMRQAIIKANSLGTFVASHCEEKSVADGAINAGKIQEELGVKGVLPEAEEIMAAREIVISETNNVRAHICHISTKTSVNMIRDAKKRGVKITCETCPHYFCFTVDEVLTSGTNAKMNPPLRDEKDRQAIIEALKDGTIDAIITDHAPHSEEEKERELSKAPNGIIGFETALPAINTYLIDKNLLTEMDMVKLTSYNPAKLLNLDKGEIKEGKIADLTIYDPEESYIYTKDMIVSKSKNTPFIGKKLKGKVKYTIVNGNIVYKD